VSLCEAFASRSRRECLGRPRIRASPAEYPAGVLVETDGIHLRGMNRNTVIVDGTKRTAAAPCSSDKKDQTLGPVEDGHHVGRNGIEIWKASCVSVQNLTVCNFLTTPSGDAGNEIWWNGGDGSGKIGMHAYLGSNLTASSSTATASARRSATTGSS
jgi:hypothetical protein